MDKKILRLSQVYRLLEPGPVVMVTTANKKGKANIMTMSWHTMIDFEPPIVGCIISNRDHVPSTFPPWSWLQPSWVAAIRLDEKLINLKNLI